MCLCLRSELASKGKLHSKMTTSSSVPCALPSTTYRQWVRREDIGRSFTMPYKFQLIGRQGTRTSGDFRISETSLFAMCSSEPLFQISWIRATLASYLSWSFMSKLETTATRSLRCLAAGVSFHTRISCQRRSTTSRFLVVAPPHR